MLNKKQIKTGIGLLLFSLAIAVIGYMQGYYNAIGVYPFTPQKTIVTEQPVPAGQTFENVSSFIADDITDKDSYEEGMNCVDYALVVARNAQWHGLDPMVIRVDYKNDPISHTMLMFNTNDQGYIFVEPQTDKVFDVFRIGGTYAGKEIVGLYVLELGWMPLEEYFEEANNNG